MKFIHRPTGIPYNRPSAYSHAIIPKVLSEFFKLNFVFWIYMKIIHFTRWTNTPSWRQR